MTEEAPAEWMNFVGEYAGRKTQKVGSGEKEAKKFTLLFKVPNSTYEKKVHVFENALATILERNGLDAIEECEYYAVSAVKNEYMSGTEKRYTWNLGKILPSTKEEYDTPKVDETKVKAAVEDLQKAMLPSVEELNAFKTKYFESCEKKNKLMNPRDFLLMFFVNKYQKEAGIVLKYGKENIVVQKELNGKKEEVIG